MALGLGGSSDGRRESGLLCGTGGLELDTAVSRMHYLVVAILGFFPSTMSPVCFACTDSRRRFMPHAIPFPHDLEHQRIDGRNDYCAIHYCT